MNQPFLKPQKNSYNLLLCGFPMSGKTTIGKKLAAKLKRNFIDTDHLIEGAYAKKMSKKSSCRSIYLEKGEDSFRSIEREALLSLKEKTESIIALGGGSLEQEENRSLISSLGEVIYLKVSIKTLWKRIQQKDLPAYLNPKKPEKAFYDLAERRIPFYESVAQWSVKTDNLSEEEIVEALLQHVEKNDGQ